MYRIFKKAKLDSAALVIFLFPLLRPLLYPFSRHAFFPLELLVLLAIVAISYNLFNKPIGLSTEAKVTKKSAKMKLPAAWHAVIRLYLFLFGSESWDRLIAPRIPYKNTMRERQYNFTSNPRNSMNTKNLTSIPQIRFVGPNAVGLIISEPATLQYFINGLWWSQYTVLEDRSIVIIQGLSENSIYQFSAVSPNFECQIDVAICTSAVPSVNFQNLAPQSITDAENIHHNSNTNATLNSNGELMPRPRKRFDIYDEALKSITQVLDTERSKSRKLKKEKLKKLASLHTDIETLNTKLVSKKKSDERVRKRIQALTERVAHHRAELEKLASSISSQDLADVDELSSKAEDIQRNFQAKRSGYDVSIRVWAELQRSKQSEINKLEQRCAKLSDRITKIRNDHQDRAGLASRMVSEYLFQLKEERNSRKTRRVRLEEDFISAIGKLNLSTN